MSHTSHESNPLLKARAQGQSEAPDKAIPASTMYAVKTLAYLRLAVGAACLVAPQFTCGLFQYSVPVGSALLVRMVGARDGVLGEMLLTAEDKNGHDGGRRETSRALWAGIAADGIDIGALTYAVAKGQVGRATGGLFGAGAVVFMGLGAWSLRRL